MDSVSRVLKFKCQLLIKITLCVPDCSHLYNWFKDYLKMHEHYNNVNNQRCGKHKKNNAANVMT